MEYIIYGAGGNGKKIHDALVSAGNKVKFFIDQPESIASHLPL